MADLVGVETSNCKADEVNFKSCFKRNPLVMASSEVSEVSEVFTTFTTDDLTHVDEVDGLTMPVEEVISVSNHDQENDDNVLYGGSRSPPTGGPTPRLDQEDHLLDPVPLPQVSPFLVSNHQPPLQTQQQQPKRRQRNTPKASSKRKQPNPVAASSDLSLSDAAPPASPPGSGSGVGMIKSDKPSSGGGWQQQQVSIKTLEGEFSVTMWASGADDGKLMKTQYKIGTGRVMYTLSRFVLIVN